MDSGRTNLTPALAGTWNGSWGVATDRASDRTDEASAALAAAPIPVLPDRRVQVLPEVALFEAGIHPLTEGECAATMLERLDAGRGGWIVLQDAPLLRRALGDPALRARLERAVRLPGRLAALACRLQRTPVPEAATGASLARCLARGAAQRGRSLFLLGDDGAVLEAAARELARTAEGLRLAGSVALAADRRSDPAALERAAGELARAVPDVVLLGLADGGLEVAAALAERLPATWWVDVGDGLAQLAASRGTLRPQRPSPRLATLAFAGGLCARAAWSGVLPKPRRAGVYGVHGPRALVVGDAPALDGLARTLAEAFPELALERASRVAGQGGRYDLCFFDAAWRPSPASALALARTGARPAARLFAVAAHLDREERHRLAREGCDGVWVEDRPETRRAALAQVRAVLDGLALRHRESKRAFGGVRHAAGAIRALLHEWNQRSEARPAERREAP